MTPFCFWSKRATQLSVSRDMLPNLNRSLGKCWPIWGSTMDQNWWTEKWRSLWKKKESSLKWWHHSLSQNRIVEQSNQTILELVCAMLILKDLPLFLWDEAAWHATYLWNQALTWALKSMTPYEAWTGKKPDVSHLHEFGCNIWVLNKTKNKSKLAPRLKKMIFVGFKSEIESG